VLVWGRADYDAAAGGATGVGRGGGCWTGCWWLRGCCRGREGAMKTGGARIVGWGLDSRCLAGI